MPAVDISSEVGSIEVVFSPERIGLRTASGEQSRHHELGSTADAADGIVIVSDEKAKLVQPVWRKLVEIADVDFMFQKVGVGDGDGKSGPSDVLIFHGAMFVRITNPELIAVGEVVEDSS